MVKEFPNQKEYLKKYLSGDKTKTKKKKHSSRKVKIIDDDEGIKNVDLDDIDFTLDGEDAPQIVVAEGSEPIALGNEIKKWKSISASTGKEESNVSKTAIKSIDHFKPTLKKERQRKNDNSDNDFSPIRKESSNSIANQDLSPPVKSYKLQKVNSDLDEDLSPPRAKSRRNSYDSDDSLNMRKSKSSRLSPRIEKSTTSKKRLKSRWADVSPSKDKVQNSDNDLSPLRVNDKSDHSPSVSGKTKLLKRSDDDFSPPRKSKNKNDRESSPYRFKNSKHRSRSPHKSRISKIADGSQNSDNDLSPLRTDNRSKSNHSPSVARKTKILKKTDDDFSPPRKSKNKSDRDSSPQRFKNSKHRSRSPHKSRTDKMADGKFTGLRTAQELKVETVKLKQQEHEFLENISSSISGRDAEPVVRNRNRDEKKMQEERERYRRKTKEDEIKQATYSKWGKGLKQIEDHATKIDEQNYESSKPLARYSDDKDLDDMLKKVERSGDPMLEYLRNKQEKDGGKNKTPLKPVYKGNAPENRFGIRPGYRWDGVDRSNGYEKKYFDKETAKLASQEDAYRYSTEDM